MFSLCPAPAPCSRAADGSGSWGSALRAARRRAMCTGRLASVPRQSAMRSVGVLELAQLGRRMAVIQRAPAYWQPPGARVASYSVFEAVLHHLRTAAGPRAQRAAMPLPPASGLKTSPSAASGPAAAASVRSGFLSTTVMNISGAKKGRLNCRLGPSVMVSLQPHAAAVRGEADDVARVGLRFTFPRRWLMKVTTLVGAVSSCAAPSSSCSACTCQCVTRTKAMRSRWLLSTLPGSH